MKNSFSYRTIRSHKSGTNRLLAVTVFVIILFVADLIAGGALRSQVRAGAGMVWRSTGSVVHSVTASGIFSSRRTLENQNRLLSEKLAQFEERSASYETLQAENDALRTLLHVVEGAVDGGNGVTAPITSSVISSPYGTFLIGAGAADGISPGSLVLTSGGFVVGVVKSVGAHSAVVSEVFAPMSSVEAVLNGASILVLGSGGGNARVKVPRGLSVAVGDPVVAPLYGERPIGIVGNVASSSASASQDVYIRLPMNLSSLRYVYVVATRN